MKTFSPLTVLSEKQSDITSSSVQCVHSGQTGMSQEVFLATPKLLCNRVSYWTTSNSYVFWHPALHTFCSLWPQPGVPGVHKPLKDNPRQPRCTADKQWLVIVQTQLHQWSGSAVSHPPLAICTEVETYRQAHFYLFIYIHPPLLMDMGHTTWETEHSSPSLPHSSRLVKYLKPLAALLSAFSCFFTCQGSLVVMLVTK